MMPWMPMLMEVVEKGLLDDIGATEEKEVKCVESRWNCLWKLETRK